MVLIHRYWVGLEQVNFEIKNLEIILKKFNSDIQKSYSEYPQEIKKYIIPIYVSDEDYIREWLSIPYDRKIIPEYCIYGNIEILIG